MDAVIEQTPRGWRARGNGIATWGQTKEEALHNLEESRQRIARLAANWRPGGAQTRIEEPTEPRPPSSRSRTASQA